MESRKGTMRLLLAENLRQLMRKNIFEKITIKQICDQTGVIRATFYNYFDDKYDCLNYIIYHDLVEPIIEDYSREKIVLKIEGLLETIDENRDFYRVAYNVTGQNSFEEMIRQNLAIFYKNYFEKYRKRGYLDKYSNELLAQYYADCISFHIRLFVFGREGADSVIATRQMILDLMQNSFTDFME